MKTLIQKTKLLGRMLIYLSASTLVVMTLAACPDGDGGGGSNTRGRTPGTPPETCTGCSNTSELLASGLGESTPGTFSDLQMALDFFMVDDHSGSIINGYYEGPVLAEGYMYIGHIQSGYTDDCSVRAGVYKVRVPKESDAGWMNYNGIIEDLYLFADGPDDLDLRVEYFTMITATPKLVSCGNHTFGQKLMGKVGVKAVNGRICNSTYFYISGPQNFNCH